MADNEQAEGAVDGAEAAPAKKGKLKLIIAVGRRSSPSSAPAAARGSS